MPAPSSPAPAVSPRPTAAPSLASRAGDYAMMTLAVVLGGGSLVLFASSGRLVLVRLELPPGGAAAWNALVSLVFFAQHSILVRRPVRARLSRVVPARYDGAFYAITSGIALALVSLLLQPAGPPLFVLHGVARVGVDAAALLAVAGFVWGVRALHGFDPFGLRPIREHLRGTPAAPSEAASAQTPLVVAGPYRWVRHPLYSCVIVLLWADPQMSLGRLAVAASWTAWIYVGARLEERDLMAEFGDRYRRYRERVPILVPWRGRAG